VASAALQNATTQLGIIEAQWKTDVTLYRADFVTNVCTAAIAATNDARVAMREQITPAAAFFESRLIDEAGRLSSDLLARAQVLGAIGRAASSALARGFTVVKSTELRSAVISAYEGTKRMAELAEKVRTEVSWFERAMFALGRIFAAPAFVLTEVAAQAVDLATGAIVNTSKELAKGLAVPALIFGGIVVGFIVLRTRVDAGGSVQGYLRPRPRRRRAREPVVPWGRVVPLAPRDRKPAQRAPAPRRAPSRPPAPLRRAPPRRRPPAAPEPPTAAERRSAPSEREPGILSGLRTRTRCHTYAAERPRLCLTTVEGQPAINGAADVCALLRGMVAADREHFVALYLSPQGRVIGADEVARGTVDAVMTHPREAFKGAILHGASAVVIAHNHPSGDPRPSREDEDLTRVMAAAGRVLGIPVLDSLVVAREGCTSLARYPLTPGGSRVAVATP
jgi:hypothetical protein